jgi:hypothetical protein
MISRSQYLDTNLHYYDFCGILKKNIGVFKTMSFFRFSSPPLLHYVVSGEDTYVPGIFHLSRKNLGVFDILIVTSGCLFMTEEDSSWEIRAGEFLLLRPDAFHKATSPTTETTHFYYLHVQPVNG